MPSSLTTVLSLTLVYSTCLPVSVLVRANTQLTLETFLESQNPSLRYLLTRSLPITSLHCMADLPTILLLRLDALFQSCARLFCLCHSFTCVSGTGISTCYPSTTLFSLILGPDLPRADEPSPGNLRQSVYQILTDISLLTPAFSLLCAPVLLTVHLQCCIERSPTTHRISFYKSIVSVSYLAPVNFRRRVTRLVSCYALFQGWLLLSQPPSCLCIPTSFST